MWLVDARIKQDPNQQIFEHKSGMASQEQEHEKRIDVKIFGGEGHGRIFRTNVVIGGMNLGEIRVGLLDKVTGFGGEIGDGCVML